MYKTVIKNTSQTILNVIYNPGFSQAEIIIVVDLLKMGNIFKFECELQNLKVPYLKWKIPPLVCLIRILSVNIKILSRQQSTIQHTIQNDDNMSHQYVISMQHSQESRRAWGGREGKGVDSELPCRLYSDYDI